MPASTGADTRVSYVWENDGSGNPDFATASPSDSDYKPFGADATMNTLEGRNNAVRVFEPSSREAAEVIEQAFEGAFSVEFTLTNPWWLRGVVDNSVSTTDNGDGSYTHTFSGDVPFPMRIVQGTESTGNERTLLGCVIASVTLSAQVGGMGTVSIDGAYADDENATPASLTSQPALNERPMTFAQASVTRGGSTLSLIQNAQLTLENNTDLIHELGSRTAADYSPKQRTADINYGDIVEDKTELERMYGSGSSVQSTVENTSNIVFQFDNGKSGSDKNVMKVTLKDAIPDSYSRSGVGDPEADLEGTLSEMAATVDAEATNGTSAAR